MRRDFCLRKFLREELILWETISLSRRSKIWGPSREIAGLSAFQVCLIQGSYFRGLLILLCLYVVYFVAAVVVSEEGGSGKFILVVIGCFLVLSLAGDVFELIHDSHDTLVNVTISFGVLIVSLEDIVQIIATIHGLKS